MLGVIGAIMFTFKLWQGSLPFYAYSKMMFTLKSDNNLRGTESNEAEEIIIYRKTWDYVYFIFISSLLLNIMKNKFAGTLQCLTTMKTFGQSDLNQFWPA